MGRNTKLNHTSKKKLHSLNSPSLRLKGGSGLADVRVTFKNLQTSVVDNGIQSMTPINLENLLENQDADVDANADVMTETPTIMSNLDKKHCVEGFLQRQANSIDNV